MIKKLLLVGDKPMPEMYSRQPRLTYIACGTFAKNKENIKKKKKKLRRSIYIYQDKLDKACFQHDVSYGDFKDLLRRTVSNKELADKAFNIAKTPKIDGYQRDLF